MAWLRLDCAMLDDDFVRHISGDEFKAWTLFLLRVKALGARGSVPISSTATLAYNWMVPETAVISMLKKAREFPGSDGKPGDRIFEDGGRWYVKNWSKYQEDHKAITARGETSGDVPDGTTLPHNNTTLQNPTKDIMNKLFSLWNSQGIRKHQEITSAIEKAFEKARKIWNVEQIQLAISNYGKILASPELYFFHYKWTLEEFLTRKNSIRQFVDPVCFENFKERKNANGTSGHNSSLHEQTKTASGRFTKAGGIRPRNGETPGATQKYNLDEPDVPKPGADSKKVSGKNS